MSRFHPLAVTGIEKTIRDAVVVTLEPQDGTPFDFAQGQYLTFRRDFGGQELRRSYSICTGLDDNRLQIGIKRVDGGAFSTWANTEMQVGDVLEAMPPQGRFTAPLEPDQGRHYLGFAGGSGITPVLSILRTVLAREPDSRFTLVYANRAVNTIMFREELEDLKNRHMGRLTVIHVLEHDTQDIDLFTGRVDGAKCAELFRHWIDIGSVDLSFICGPEPMMLAITQALRDHGVPEDRIKFELFKSDQPGRLPQKLAERVAESEGTELKVTLDGATRTVHMEPGVPVLDAVRAQDIDAPFACKAGVCSTCRAKVLDGEYEMIANHALEDYEVEAGYVLTCQCVPLGATLAVDYDQ